MLIGCSGRAGSGKDTFANFICELNPSFSKYSLASPIKELCNNLFDWDSRHSYGDLKEVVDPYWGVSPRRAYQALGTEFGRNCINQELWIMKAQREYEKRGKMVVPDIRFENEVAWLRKNNGILVFIERPGMKLIELSAHVSETGIDKLFGVADYVLDNSGDLGLLATNAKLLLKEKGLLPE